MTLFSSYAKYSTTRFEIFIRKKYVLSYARDGIWQARVRISYFLRNKIRSRHENIVNEGDVKSWEKVSNWALMNFWILTAPHLLKWAIVCRARNDIFHRRHAVTRYLYALLVTKRVNFDLYMIFAQHLIPLNKWWKKFTALSVDCKLKTCKPSREGEGNYHLDLSSMLIEPTT